MTRQLHMEMDDEVSEKTHRGCIWGIFHALKYNYWKKNVKRMLPTRKHYLPKYSKGSGRTRTTLIAYGSDEVKAVHLPLSSNTRKHSSTNKRSLRTLFKSLITECSSKKNTYKQRGLGSPTQSRFQQTYSSHHLECSDYILRKSTPSDDEFNEGKIREFYKKDKKSDANMVLLEMYRANKDLFAKGLRQSDGGIAKSFCDLENSEAQVKLTRSGSYPPPKLSQIKSFKSSRLDHKHNEIWSQLKSDKFTTKYSRRTLSLNESSFEKYVQSVHKSLTGEPKLSSSKSMRLTYEFSFKRVHSLSRGDYCGIFKNDSPCDGQRAILVVKGDFDSNQNIGSDSHSVKVEGINENETAEEPKISEEIEEEVFVLEDSKKEEEVELVGIEEKLPNSSSILVVQRDLENVSSAAGFLTSEDFKWENNCKSEFHTKSYDDFNYVSDILDSSGFRRNDLLAPWYSLDEPLNPSVFDDVEACWHHKNSSPEDEVCCHHQILFDLINEVLVQIYDTLFTYYPRALSSNCKVPPMPKKFNLLEDLWGKLSKIMSMKLGSDQTVGDIVAQDIWNDDRWMNLQLESECVALELEDMLFEELLEEIRC